MKKPLKAIVAVALAFTAAGFVATSGSAKADIIDVPGAVKSIPQVNLGNVLTNYDSDDLKTIDNTSPVGNMDRKYNQGTIDPSMDNQGDTFATTAATTTTAKPLMFDLTSSNLLFSDLTLLKELFMDS